MRIEQRRKSVPKRALFESGGTSVSMLASISENAESPKGILNEQMDVYTPVYFQNGMLYKAGLTRYAEYITLESGLQNQVVNIMRYGFIDLIGTGDLFLGDGILTETPDIQDGVYLQKIGTKADNGYYIDINDYAKIEL